MCGAAAFEGQPTLPTVAATGAIDLSGRVLVVSGIRQKAIAAHQAQMKALIIPKVPAQPAHRMDEGVLCIAYMLLWPAPFMLERREVAERLRWAVTWQANESDLSGPWPDEGRGSPPADVQRQWEEARKSLVFKVRGKAGGPCF